MEDLAFLRRIVPAVVESRADHKLVIVGEADVGHMRRVAEVMPVFGLKSENHTSLLVR